MNFTRKNDEVDAETSSFLQLRSKSNKTKTYLNVPSFSHRLLTQFKFALINFCFSQIIEINENNWNHRPLEFGLVCFCVLEFYLIVADLTPFVFNIYVFSMFFSTIIFARNITNIIFVFLSRQYFRPYASSSHPSKTSSPRPSECPSSPTHHNKNKC